MVKNTYLSIKQQSKNSGITAKGNISSFCCDKKGASANKCQFLAFRNHTINVIKILDKTVQEEIFYYCHYFNFEQVHLTLLSVSSADLFLPTRRKIKNKGVIKECKIFHITFSWFKLSDITNHCN